MDFSDFTAGPDDDGRRADRILRRFLSQESLPQLYKAIRKDFIRVNGHKIGPSQRIFAGDIISVADFLLNSGYDTGKKSKTKEFANSLFFYNTLFRNDFIQIIDKPYDICVQGKESLEPFVTEEWRQRQKKNDKPASLSFTPGPLHRLDRKTTGVLAFSQNIDGARWFSAAISEHRIEKIYVGIVQGTMQSLCTWSDTISPVNEKNESDESFHTVHINSSIAYGKLAETTAVPIAAGQYGDSSVSFVEFKIGTGRMHQIRAQAAYHGYPLLGDTSYGGIKIREPRDIYLHAYEMRLPVDNPIGLPDRITAPISTEFQNMLHKILINWDGTLII